MTVLNNQMVCHRFDMKVPSAPLDVLLPDSARVGCVRLRGDRVEIWAYADPSHALRQRRFHLVPLVLSKPLAVVTTSPLVLLGVVEPDPNFPPFGVFEELEVVAGEASQATAAAAAA